ncbi:hypothetical protein N8563_00645 [bacterium]|nr:hypothetical protein [bacterium]
MAVYIICPSGTTTGGVESLHQLGYMIKSTGRTVYMSYYPDPSGGITSQYFTNYGLSVQHPIDAENSIIVVPEIATYWLKQFIHAKLVVYWLSVDNYLCRKHESLFIDVYKRIRSLTSSRIPVFFMKRFHHITQSEYANNYLLKKGIVSTYIGDYLNDYFYEELAKVKSFTNCKSDQVAFNPRKGSKYIEYVSSLDPSINFVPIVNMSRSQVLDTLLHSKIYIDLGHHPGRDRIPREAAALGCCIITSIKGSANNNVDVPLPDQYKYRLSNKSLNKLPSQIKFIFNNYSDEFLVFQNYRSIIQNDRSTVTNNVSNWISTIDPKPL